MVIDIETTGLSPHTDKLHGIAVDGRYYTWPFPAPVLERLASNEVKVGHNLVGFDVPFLRAHGVAVGGLLHDTRSMAHLVDENKPLNLKKLVARYGLAPLTEKQGLDELVDAMGFKHVGELCAYTLSAPAYEAHIVAHCNAQIARYAEEDARNTELLYAFLTKELKRLSANAVARGYSKGPWQCWLEEVMPADQVICALNCRGIRVRPEVLDEMEQRLLAERAQVLEQLAATPGLDIVEQRLATVERAKYKSDKGRASVVPGKGKCAFNWASGRHVAWLLYDVMQAPEQLTEKGQPDVSEEAVAPYLPLLPRLRQIDKELSTYVQGMRERIVNGRIYPGYNQYAVTGRFRSSNPNIQNLPRTSDVKKLFVPDSPEHVFLHVDYSQVELRIAAHLSGDENMKRIFIENRDAHTETARVITKKDEVTKEERQRGKTCNFLLIFFGSAWRLKHELGCTIEEAETIHENYFAGYSQYLKHLERIRHTTLKKGYLVAESGRIRTFEDPNEKCVKQAYNFPVQSLGAHMTKKALVALHRAGFDVVTTVHDSITIQLYKGERAEEAVRIIENAYKLSVPVVADTETKEHL